MALIREEDPTARSIIDLLRLRERPVREPAIEVHERTTREGDRITILKNPLQGKYFRLSQQGRFIWDLDDDRRRAQSVAIAWAGSATTPVHPGDDP